MSEPNSKGYVEPLIEFDNFRNGSRRRGIADHSGKTVGDLQVLRFPPGKKADGKIYWICLCHRCGRLADIPANYLYVDSSTKACGCAARNRRKRK